MSASTEDIGALFSYYDQQDGGAYPGYINIEKAGDGKYLIISVRGVSNPDREPEEMQWKVLPRSEALKMIECLAEFAKG